MLILEDGIRVGDVSAISPDHAVAVDPASAESVEIVRGPANLLYGSDAIGGVVNVINGEVPTRRLAQPSGSLLVAGGSNADELSSAGEFHASSGPVAFRLGASHRDADEFEFDGGVAGNSQYEIDTGNAGVSLVGPAGAVGVSYRRYEADYGIPVSEDGDAIDGGDPGVTLDLEQDSYKLLGEISRPFGGFEGARLQVMRRDYTHAEIEDTGDVGTVFNLDTTEMRADLTHRALGRWKGSFGLWRLDQEFDAEGEEVLVPGATTRGVAGFIYEELGFERVRYLFGGRFESRKVEPDSGEERDFDAFSGAAGAVVTLGKLVSLALNLTHNFKAPTAEELFANGPHVATFAFEVGDPDLEEETSNGVDVSLRMSWSRFNGELNLFGTRFNDFIFIAPTGGVDVDSGLPIFAYTQADAEFLGAEWHGDIRLKEHVTLELLADYVRAENRETDEPLPRIPPPRFGAGLHWETERFFARGEVRGTDRQDRVASVEEETGGYAIYNLMGGVTFASKGIVHRISLRAENLTDKLYRNHVSLVKDIVPQLVRNVQLTYRLFF